MKVTLMGPDDLSYWFLTDGEGNSFPLVERHEDHPTAAALFGWMDPKGVTAEAERIDAIDCLMENIGEEIEAPQHVAQFLRELQQEVEE